MSKIEGKVIAITGASSGIGEAAAKLLAERGAHVVLGARRTERLESLATSITANGGSARVRSLDVTSFEDMQAFVDFAKSEFGRVDVIVNNAGVMPLSPLSSLKVDEWNRMIDVNKRTADTVSATRRISLSNATPERPNSSMRGLTDRFDRSRVVAISSNLLLMRFRPPHTTRCKWSP